MKYKLFETGGHVRDFLLGIKSKDIDYSVVIDVESLPKDIFKKENVMEVVFNSFVSQLKIEGYEIFLETPSCLTVRGKFPKGHKNKGPVDFVIARKELYYPESGRRPVSKLGILEDDLRRRDFTLNAMAKDEDGKIIDLFGGYTDLMNNTLKTPGDPYKSFKDDPLRIIRAMRFCVTKGFVLSKEVRQAIQEVGIQGIEKVSVERIREELEKCFTYDTLKTLEYLYFMKFTLKFDLIGYAFRGTSLRLQPTMKQN